MKDKNYTQLSVYIPSIKACATITGACLKDGKARLIWKTDDHHFGTMDIDTFVTLVEQFLLPY